MTATGPPRLIYRQEEPTCRCNSTPLHPLFAAEVQGVDLRSTPGPDLCAEIDRAMDRYAVLVFRNQHLDDDQQMAFGRALGPLETTRGVVEMRTSIASSTAR